MSAFIAFHSATSHANNVVVFVLISKKQKAAHTFAHLSRAIVIYIRVAHLLPVEALQAP